MGLFLSKKQQSLITLYSTIFLIVSQLLFFKISPQLYSIFNPLPFLIIGQAIKYSNFLKSCVLALLIMVLINTVKESFFPKQMIVFHFIISCAAIFFYGSFHLSKKKKLDSSNFLSALIITFIFIFAFFYLIFFNDSEYEKLNAFLQKSINQIISSYGLYKNNDLDKAIEIIIMIFPSLNSLIFLTTFSLNLIFSKIILKKIELKQITNINFMDFTTPLWFSLIYLMILILIITLNSNSQLFILSINVLICMSFCFLLEGFITFNDYFKKIKINNFIKFIIIFLLLVFLGYLLVFILLLIGLFENISKKMNKKS